MALRITRPGVMLTVGIVLATAVLIGGLVWVRHAGEQARRAEAVKLAEERLKEESRRDIALNEGGKNQAEQKNDATPGDAAQGGQQAGENQVAGGSSAGNGAAQAELPQTGPASAFVTLLGAASVTFVGVSYVRSRQLLSAVRSRS